MKKIVLGLLLCLLCFTLLTACGRPEPPREKEITRDLPDEVKTLVIENRFDKLEQFVLEEEFRENTSDVYEMDVESVSIEKRQTNQKEDIAYCAVTLKNTYYRFTKYVELHYNYYDQGGWILDEWNTYAPNEWEVLEVPIKGERIAQLVGQRYTTVDDGTVEQDLEKGTVEFFFEVKNPHANGSYMGTAIVTCQFDGVGWQYEINTDDVRFVWLLEGTWQYYKSETDDIVYHKTITHQIDVSIESFDQDAVKMQGTWYMLYSLRHIETQASLDNESLVKITADQNQVTLSNGSSFITFYPDRAEAMVTPYAGIVPLERKNEN